MHVQRPGVSLHRLFEQLQARGGKGRGHEHVGLDPGGPFMLGQEAWTFAYSQKNFNLD